MKAHLSIHHEGASPAIFDLVDWPLFHAATLSTSFLKRLFIIKWMNELLALVNRVPPRTAPLLAAATTKTGSTSSGAPTDNANKGGQISSQS
jgi:hypothetical protein